MARKNNWLKNIASGIPVPAAASPFSGCRPGDRSAFSPETVLVPVDEERLSRPASFLPAPPPGGVYRPCKPPLAGGMASRMFRKLIPACRITG